MARVLTWVISSVGTSRNVAVYRSTWITVQCDGITVTVAPYRIRRYLDGSHHQHMVARSPAVVQYTLDGLQSHVGIFTGVFIVALDAVKEEAS